MDVIRRDIVEIDSEELGNICSRLSGSDELRREPAVFKKFWEEIYPISIVLRHVGAAAKVAYCGSNTNMVSKDCDIFIGGKHLIVECVTAIDHRNRKLAYDQRRNLMRRSLSRYFTPNELLDRDQRVSDGELGAFELRLFEAAGRAVNSHEKVLTEVDRKKRLEQLFDELPPPMQETILSEQGWNPCVEFGVGSKRKGYSIISEGKSCEEMLNELKCKLAACLQKKEDMDRPYPVDWYIVTVENWARVLEDCSLVKYVRHISCAIKKRIFLVSAGFEQGVLDSREGVPV